MPLYEFVCQQCDCEQELLIRGEEQPHCEDCGSGELTRLLSAPVAHSASAGVSQRPEGPCGSGCGCFPG